MPVTDGVQVMADEAGVLPDFEIEALHAGGAVRCSEAPGPGQVQPASLDLRLALDAYRLRASFLPGRERTVAEMLQEPGIHLHRIDLTQEGAVLETGCVYLVPLQEALRLPAGIAARANPKSSTGRIDVFTRLVTNRARAFDEVATGYAGPLYLEVSPRTFPIKVRPGDRLAQIRFKRRRPQTLREKIVSIDLQPPPGQPAGFRAKPHSGVVDLRGLGAHPTSQFWEPVYPRDGRIVLNPEEFYILVSRESVRVGASEAAEMAPIAPELGEFRAHYAGFFDPGFGTNPGGSRAVLEVRSRDVPFILEHGQPVAKLVYEPMTARPRSLYGSEGSSYQGQGLKLSKHFGQ
jgi:dCTP deaminase